MASHQEVQRRETGDSAPKQQGGNMGSRRVEERAGYIVVIQEERKGIALDDPRLALGTISLMVCVAGLHRFFVRRGMTRKRMAHPACKQDFEKF